MDTLRSLAATLAKMFAADLWLSLGALAALALCRAGLAAGLVPASAIPFLLAGGVAAALTLGVLRGARR